MFRFVFSFVFTCLAWSTASFGDPVKKEGYSEYCLGALKAHFEYEIKNNYIDAKIANSKLNSFINLVELVTEDDSSDGALSNIKETNDYQDGFNLYNSFIKSGNDLSDISLVYSAQRIATSCMTHVVAEFGQTTNYRMLLHMKSTPKDI